MARLVAMQQFVLLGPHLTAIAQLGAAEILLRILTDYEPSFRALAAELVATLLADRGADRSLTDSDGNTAAQVARSEGHSSLAELLT